MGRTLIVCAHPDDEMGCMGTMVGLVGYHVDTLFFTDGVASRNYSEEERQETRGARTREMVTACGTLGVRVSGLPAEVLPDNAMDTVGVLHVARMVENKLRNAGPFEVIYTHQPNDLNVDHRIVCQAVLTATRPVPGQTVKAVYGFEVPSSTEWAFGAPPFAPNVFQPLTDDQMERKRQALRCYASELRDFPHPRSIEAVDALARYRGSQCGHPWAEAFQLLREVR